MKEEAEAEEEEAEEGVAVDETTAKTESQEVKEKRGTAESIEMTEEAKEVGKEEEEVDTETTEGTTTKEEGKEGSIRIRRPVDSPKTKSRLRSKSSKKNKVPF